MNKSSNWTQIRFVNSNGDVLRFVVEPDNGEINPDHISWFSYVEDIDRDDFFKIGDVQRIA